MGKKVFAVIVASILVLMSTNVFAGTTYVYDMYQGKGFTTYYLFVNNKEIKTPILYRDYKVYLPLKAIVTAMGETCTVSGKTAAVTKKDKTKIVYTSGSPAVKAGGSVKYLYPDYATVFERNDYKPLIANNIFYIPENYFTRILGYDLNTDFKAASRQGYANGSVWTYYVGKAPNDFYQQTVYSFMSKHDVLQEVNELKATNQKYDLIPVQDFSGMEGISATRDPSADFVRVSKAMPLFIYNLSTTQTGFMDSEDKIGLKKYVSALEDRTLRADHIVYGYDSLGYYNYPMNALCVNQDWNSVSIGINGMIGTYGLTGDNGETTTKLDFNVANALYHLIKYFMPKDGDALFKRMQKDIKYNTPVRYGNDKCTVTFSCTTGPTFLKIAWDPVDSVQSELTARQEEPQTILYAGGKRYGPVKGSFFTQGDHLKDADVIPYIPIKPVVEGMGDSYQGFGTDNYDTVKIKLKNGDRFEFTRDKAVMLKNDRTEYLKEDQNGVIRTPIKDGDDLYLPLYMVTGCFGYQVTTEKIGKDNYIFIGDVVNVPQTVNVNYLGDMNYIAKTLGFEATSEQIAVYNPLAGPEKDAYIRIATGNENRFSAMIILNAWAPDKNLKDSGNIQPLSAKLFKHYFPKEGDKLYKYVDQVFKGHPDSTVFRKIIRLEGGEVFIDKYGSSVYVCIAPSGDTYLNIVRQ